MSWRERLLSRLSPELLSGVTFARWLQILRENSFRIDLPFWPRAFVTTLFSLRNSMAAPIESLLHGRAIRETEVREPLFILGIFRSGTTLLQNLIAQDRRLTSPSMYEVTFPQTFLTTQRLDSAFLGFFLPHSRPQDSVGLAFDRPHEDEVAFCAMLGRTFLLDMAFPRNADFYRRYYTLRDLTSDELVRWKAAVRYFAGKLTYKHQRPLVMKSPGHTCRIRTLLEVFPDAKFVHIHRHPIDVFQSWRHLVASVAGRWGFQRQDETVVEEDILHHYSLVYDAYLEDRHLIPDGRLHEVSFEELTSQPLDCVSRIYSQLNLPAFEETKESMLHFLAAEADYQKNTYPPLPVDLKERIVERWTPYFAEWGYPCA